MPYVTANAIRLSCQRGGRGDDVLLIQGSSAAAHVWTMHQTPALHEAGYGTVIFDNRGIPPSDVPPGPYALADLVADTLGLIEALDLAPCHVLGTSLGAMVAQELALHAPGLVRSAVLMATRARADRFRRAQNEAEQALRDSGIRLPRGYTAVRSVREMLSSATLNDDVAVSGWLDLFELAGGGPHADGGQAWADLDEDRREALSGIEVPCRVITFTEDLIAPPHLGAEVADAIPDCDLVEIAGCGHLGHLERPDPVNAAIIEFFDKH